MTKEEIQQELDKYGFEPIPQQEMDDRMNDVILFDE